LAQSVAPNWAGMGSPMADPCGWQTAWRAVAYQLSPGGSPTARDRHGEEAMGPDGHSTRPTGAEVISIIINPVKKLDTSRRLADYLKDVPMSRRGTDCAWRPPILGPRTVPRLSWSSQQWERAVGGRPTHPPHWMPPSPSIPSGLGHVGACRVLAGAGVSSWLRDAAGMPCDARAPPPLQGISAPATGCFSLHRLAPPSPRALRHHRRLSLRHPTTKL
jgi:hypothetical protein